MSHQQRDGPDSGHNSSNNQGSVRGGSFGVSGGAFGGVPGGRGGNGEYGGSREHGGHREHDGRRDNGERRDYGGQRDYGDRRPEPRGGADEHRQSGGERSGYHRPDTHQRSPQRGRYDDSKNGDGSRGGHNQDTGANNYDQRRSAPREDYAPRQDNQSRSGHHGQDGRDSRGGSNNYGASLQENSYNHANSDNRYNSRNTDRSSDHQQRNDNYGGRGNEHQNRYDDRMRPQDRSSGRQNQSYDDHRPNGQYSNDRGNDRGGYAGNNVGQNRGAYTDNQNRGSYQDNQNRGSYNDNQNRGSYNDNQNRNGYQQGGGRDNGFNRDGERDGGFNRDRGFNENHGNNRGNRPFENDGGFGNESGGNDSRDNGQGVPQPEVAPRDWVPEVVPVDELIENTARLGDELRLSDDQVVEIRNSDIETRLTSWANSGLHEKIVENMAILKYNSVRPIQAAVIPQIMAGYDVVGQAETGGGKTAAFGLPIIDYVLRREQEDREQAHIASSPYALILAPTRELARQIYDNLRMFSKGTDVKTCLSYGQMPTQDSIRDINNGCDILVGTSGRMMDFLARGVYSLSRLKFFVLDEADHLLKGLNDDPLEHLGRIVNNEEFKSLANFRQTILTSATFNTAVERVATGLMKPGPLGQDMVRIVLAKGRLNPRCNLQFEETRGGLVTKQARLKELLAVRENGRVPKTLIFVEKKVQCDHLALKINRSANGEFAAHTLHGGRSQDHRDSLLLQFRKSEIMVLVATDVCARGIDIRDLDRVINFDAPIGTAETALDCFIHRVGRCGRLHAGNAITFIDPANDNDGKLAVKLVELLRADDRNYPSFLDNLARDYAGRVNAEDDRGGRGRSGNNRGGGFGGGGRSGGFGGQQAGGFGGFGGQAASGFGGYDAVGFEAANASAEKFESKGFAPSVGGGFGFAAKKKTEEAAVSSATPEGGDQEKNDGDLGSTSFGAPAPEAAEKKVEEQVDAEDDW